MTDGIDAAMDRVKQAASDPLLNRPPPHPMLDHLPPGNEPMLTFGHGGNPPIQVLRSTWRTTSDAFYIYGLYNASLVSACR